MRRQTSYILGQRSNQTDNTVTFGVSKQTARRHTYIIGKSGTGKSTLLRNLIVQIIANKQGLILIDPHGDLSEEIMDCIPPHRVKDAIYLNPQDIEYPMGLNLLGNVPQDGHDKVTEDIISIFKSIWGDSWGPRMEYILRNSLYALLDIPGSTLLGVSRLFHDDRYRRAVTQRIKNPAVQSFWHTEFPGYIADRRHREYVSPIENKLGRLTSNLIIRNMIGQTKNRIKMRECMDSGKIIIANLAKGALGDGVSSLLGSFLVSMTQQAAMSRRDMPERYRRDFYLVADEYHNFTTESFTSILSEARKYRLNLVLAHQYISQVPEAIQDAVFGNVGSMISFQIGAQDSQRLASEFDNEWPARQFVELQPYEVIAKLTEHSKMSQPFLGKTLPPIEYSFEKKQAIMNQTRANYCMHRNVIEDKLNRTIF